MGPKRINPLPTMWTVPIGPTESARPVSLERDISPVYFPARALFRFDGQEYLSIVQRFSGFFFYGSYGLTVLQTYKFIRHNEHTSPARRASHL